MTIVIDLPPEEEARLRARASQYGQEISDYLKLLATWEAGHSDQNELDEEELALLRAGIQRGLADEAAGKTRPFEEFVRQMQARHGLPQL